MRDGSAIYGMLYCHRSIFGLCCALQTVAGREGLDEQSEALDNIGEGVDRC